MVDFELLERDGLARLGRFSTPHGTVETPSLLPVVHPDPARQPVAPTRMREEFGLRALITSAYITWRTPPLRAVAERDGIHGLVHFDGPIMTDSGAFQQHAYGSVEVGPDEIMDFQQRIGSDIATVLDRFTEPESPRAAAEAALAETLDRAVSARARHPGLLAVPIQGGAFDDLRVRSAAAASELGDVLALGGVVPLLEQYRFVDLARAVAAARPSITPGAPLHLFGAGHPLVFAFAALAGVDLVDSSAYHKFARRGELLFSEGTVALDDVREEICRCALCRERPLPELRRRPAAEREAHLAAHNLLVSSEEMARVRQAIRDGTLWELAERRATAHPALRAGLEELARHPEIFLPVEPESRRAFRETGPGSLGRPSAVRFRRRLSAFGGSAPTAHRVPRVALTPEFLGRIPPDDPNGRPVRWEVDSPFGPVPIELSDLYPVGPFLGISEFLGERRRTSPGELGRIAAAERGATPSPDRDWSAEWDRRQVDALLRWQYGPEVAAGLGAELTAERSRRTGRIRRLVAGHAPWFVVGDDGLPRPTFRGATRLHALWTHGERRVAVADDAVPFVRAGRSLFARFVVGADPALVPDASALLVDGDDALLAVGRLLLAPHEIPRFRRGVAARVTSHAAAPDVADDAPDAPESDR
ncbi:MAG TPA: tRNA guanosine(15) transglycosylase TgtA [Thermoplasmata archaeon]|nr:tRNA guanosine(15) transglycosylase TgtA [Thermoplasmata archaeon]